MLIIDFKLDMTTQEYEELSEAVAPEIAQIPGLLRETWLWDPQTQDAGGVYLFDDDASVDRYLNGPVIQQLRGLPQVSEVRTRRFQVLEQPSSMTRGIQHTAASLL